MDIYKQIGSVNKLWHNELKLNKVSHISWTSHLLKMIMKG